MATRGRPGERFPALRAIGLRGIWIYCLVLSPLSTNIAQRHVRPTGTRYVHWSFPLLQKPHDPNDLTLDSHETSLTR
ncbi:MAG: hypothetical protein CMJ70_25665 [Planctomycetaceae bacterium]|nr:hypothetical protein [Planctomycetaceae bacterium]HAA69476.1 hypothetical protein [Planctomycetaceae bacterium]